MKTIKKLFYLSAIIVALVMSSCSKDKYKNYIPADSKMVGKIDMEAFFEQTGVDKDKLGLDKIKEIGLDLSKPAYIFGRSDGFNITFGIIAKVDDRDKLNTLLGSRLEKGNGYDYHIDDNMAVGIDKHALVIVFVPMGGSSDAKDALEKVMKKEFKGDIDDNKLFNKVKDSKSFACLYADMSIVPAGAVDMLGRKDERLRNLFNDIRKMTIGIDGTFNNGILDYELWAKSDDSKVQERIDRVKSFLKPVKGYGAETLPDDVYMGMTSNINGSEIAKYINSLMSDFELMNELNYKTKEDIILALSFLKSINGDFVGYMKFPMEIGIRSEDVVVAMETDRDISKDIAQLLAGGSALPDSVGQADGSQVNYNRRGHMLVETDNGYCLDDNMWFGYNNGALCLASNNNLLSNAYGRADNPLPSNIRSFLTSRRFVLFVNYSKVLEMTNLRGVRNSNVDALSELLSKLKVMTISIR